MTVLLKNDAGKTAPADNEDFLVVLFELFDQRDEIAVAANNNKGIDVVSRERHLQRVQRQVNVGPVLVAAGRQVSLHHLDRVLGHAATVFARALPVTVGNLSNDFAAFLNGLENCADIEVTTQRGPHSKLDIVKVDEYGDL